MNGKIKIVAVFHYANGMTMVFDENGEQTPELQGKSTEFPVKCREHAERFDFSDCRIDPVAVWSRGGAAR